MKKRKRFKLFAMLTILLALLIGCSSNNTSEQAGSTDKSNEGASGGGEAVSGVVPIYTPGAGGIGYILNAGISNMFNNSKVMPDVQLVTEATSGSAEIMTLAFDRAAQGKHYIASNSGPHVTKLYNGTDEVIQGEFKELRGIGVLGFAAVHLVVPADSDIKSFADLKGKKVGANPGSAPEALLVELLDAGYGLTKDDYQLLPLGYAEVQQAIQDGSLDAGILAGAFPAPTVKELEQSADIRILSIDEEAKKKFEEKFPYYSFATAPANTYKNQGSDIVMATVTNLQFTHDYVSEDLVYNYVKTILENPEDFNAIHPSAKGITKETILEGVNIPLHPGAEKYYKEQGILK